MNVKELRQELTDTIISENGVLKFDFVFDTDNSGWVYVFDNQLEVRFKAEWEFDSLTQVIIMTIKHGDPLDRTREIISYLSEFRNKLMQMESAYDVVGE